MKKRRVKREEKQDWVKNESFANLLEPQTQAESKRMTI